MVTQKRHRKYRNKNETRVAIILPLLFVNLQAVSIYTNQAC